jgi:cobalt-zinc-cadmium efflux system membrane fusion protein
MNDEANESRTGRDGMRLPLFVASLAIVGGLGLWGGTRLHADAKADATAPDTDIVRRQGDTIVVPSGSPLRPRLQVAQARLSGGSHELTMPAVVEVDPARTVNILPPLTGVVSELKVRLGDHVAKGQVLAVLRSPDLEQAYADADKARDAMALAQRALARAQGVNEAGGNAVKDLEQAQSDANQAKAELDRAQARLRILGASSEPSAKGRAILVKSPASGVVTSLSTAVGSYLNDPTVALMVVASLDRIWVTANLPEDRISAIRPGQPVVVSLPALPGETLRGKVGFVDPAMDPDTRRNKVRVEFANPGERLKPNMYASATFALDQGSQVTVPTSAILMNNDNTSVFVETAPWRFVRRAVELGTEDSGSVRILAGLVPNDRILVKGGVLLND